MYHVIQADNDLQKMVRAAIASVLKGRGAGRPPAIISHVTRDLPLYAHKTSYARHYAITLRQHSAVTVNPRHATVMWRLANVADAVARSNGMATALRPALAAATAL